MASLVKLNNIFDITDRTITTIVPGQPIYTYIGESIDGCDLVISINGHITEDYNYIIQENDSLAIVPILTGGGGKDKTILRMVAMIALAMFTPTIAGYINTTMFGGALAADGLGMMILRGAVSVIGGMIINALLPVPKPDNTNVNSELSTVSPTYSFSGGSNAKEAGSTLPIMLGKARVAPPVIASYLSMDGDNQYLNVLYAVNDGVLDNISDVYIQDQPIGNYSNVSYTRTLGTTNQNTIGNFRDTILSSSVNVTIDSNSTYATIASGTLTPGGCSLQALNNTFNTYASAFSSRYYSQGSGCADSTLKYSLNSLYRMVTSDGVFYGDGHYLWQGRTVTGADTSHNGDTSIQLQHAASLGVGSHTHTTIGLCDEVDIVLFLAKGLYRVNDDGSYSDRSIGVKIEYKKHSSSIWTTFFNGSISGTYKSPTRKVFNISNLFSIKLDIRITRTSAYDEDSRTANSLVIDYVNEITYDDFKYPGVALLAINAMATDQLNGGFPTVTCLVDNRTIMVNGVTKSKDNPAWACYDLLRRYDIPDSKIDLVAFETWATFCESKNFKCNLYLDNQMELQAALNMISLLGRGTILQFGTKFSPVVEMPIDIPTQTFLFTGGNMVDMELNYIPYNERSNVIEVTYYDETDDYKSKTLQVQSKYFDSVTEEIKSSINLYGCTLAAQASSYAQFLLNSNQYITKSAIISVDIDAVSCTIGDVIKIGKKYMTNTIADGRIVSATETSITIDQNISLMVDSNYELQYRTADDIIHVIDVPSSLIPFNIETNVIPTNILSAIPEPYDVFAFGYQNTEATDLFRVINITRSSDQKRKITAIEYIPGIYDDSANIDIENVVFVSSIQGLTATDYIRKAISGTGIECMLSLNWIGNALYYDVYLDNKKVDRVYRNMYDISNVKENYTYTIKVVDSYGKSNSIQYTVLGRYINPDPVTSLTITELGSTYTLSWGYATKPIDFKEYIIYLQGSEIGRTTLNEFKYYSAGLEIKEFAVRAIDSVNLLSSAVYVYGSAKIPNPVNSPINADITNGKLTLTWTHTKEEDFAKYLVYRDTTLIGSSTEKLFQYTELGDLYLSSINYFVSVVDVSGLESTKVSTIVNVTYASVSNITHKFDKNNLLLQWSSTPGTFSIDKYKIVINGDTYYAGASTFSAPVKWLGSRNVSIYAIDTAGNSGTASTTPVSITAATAATITTAISITSGIEFLWTEPIATVGVKEYEVTYNGSITVLADRRYFVPTIAQGTYSINVVAIDHAGNRGTTATKSVVIGTPTISNIVHTAKGRTLTLSWTGNASTFNIQNYHISYTDGSGITQHMHTPHQYFSIEPNWIGTRVFSINAIDVAGNAGNISTYTTTISGPGTPVLDYNIVNKDVLLSIVPTLGSFDLAVQEIKYYSDDTIPVLITVTVPAGTPIFTLPITWDRNKTFTVTSIDTLGNRSASNSIDIEILESEVTSITAEVVDNNILLRWVNLEGTLPVDVFKINKGDTYATSIEIGNRKGTFATIFEQLGGIYTYWITPVDSAGNEGKYKSITATVNEPPDYVLNADWTSDWTGTSTNTEIVGGHGYLPVNTTETYQGHFTSRSWSTIQNQISAGYPLWLSPTNSTATYSQTFDYQTTIPATSVTITHPDITIFGSGTYTMHWTIETSVNGSTWVVQGIDVTKLFITSGMRYLKVTYSYSISDNKTILQVGNFRATLNTKIRNDAGSLIVSSADTYGTIANFNVDFIDIASITLSPVGTEPRIPIYDFQDSNVSGTYSVVSNIATITCADHNLRQGQKVKLSISSGTGISGTYTVASVTSTSIFTINMVTPNTSGNLSIYPESFRIYLYDDKGTRQSGSVSWSARGY